MSKKIVKKMLLIRKRYNARRRAARLDKKLTQGKNEYFEYKRLLRLLINAQIEIDLLNIAIAEV